MMETAVKAVIFSVILLSFVTGQEWIGCFSPQFAQESTRGYIRCTFPSAFRAVYWYDNVTNENANPFLSYTNGVKSGEGYESGEYNVYQNGTLVINSVRLKHEKRFKALCIDRDEIGRIFVVSLQVTVPPSDQHPQIYRCSIGDPCFLYYNSSEKLICNLKGIRPAPDLHWIVNSGNEENELDSAHSTTVEDNTITYSVTSSTDAMQYEQNVLAALVCKAVYDISNWRSETQALVDLSPSKQFYGNEPLDIYGELNGAITLPCSIARIENYMILWKKGNHESSEVLAYSVFGKDVIAREMIHSVIFHNDGSLTISQLALQHEGMYTFVGSNGVQNKVSLIQLKVMIPPSPPYLIVSQCPTIHHCVIERDQGILTCATSGVRPLISVRWSKGENSGVHFSPAKSTSQEKMGLFDVSTEVEYVIEESVECGARIEVTCEAFGQAAATFQSTITITLMKGSANCTSSIPENSARRKPWIIPVVILVTVALGISCGVAILRRCVTKHRGIKSLEAGSPEENHPLQQSNEQSTRQHITYEEQKEKKMKLAELLRNAYESKFDYDGIYIPPNLSYVQARKHPGDVIAPTPKPLKSYHQFFTGESFISRKRRIIIEGGIGYGKTLLALQMAQEWCRRDNSSPIKDTEFFILISLKGIDDKLTIYDSVWKQLLFDDCGLKPMDVQNIMENEQSCVLILDHYYEYQERRKHLKLKESCIDKIMNSELLPNAKVIFLSAVQQEVHENIYSKNPPVVTIGEFTDDQIVKYITHMFHHDEHMIRRFQEKIQQNGVIANLSHIPLFLRMISTTFMRHNELRFDKLTSFLEDWFQIKFNYINENKQFKLNIKEMKDMNKFAYECISSSQTTWTRKEFIQKVTEESFTWFEKMGIIVETKFQTNKSPSEDAQQHRNDNNNVRFIHTIYQQFLAAHYVAFDADESEIKQFLNNVDFAKNLQIVIFACGLHGEYLNIVIRHLINLKIKDSPLPLEEYLYSCLYEVDSSFAINTELQGIFRNFHGITIDGGDKAVITKGKIFAIEKADEYKITIPYIAMKDSLKGVTDEEITLVCGSSCQMPKNVTNYFIDDSNFQITEAEPLLSFLEKNEDIESLVVISRKRPEKLTKECTNKLQRQRKMCVIWKTVDDSNNGNIVKISYPSVNTSKWTEIVCTDIISDLERILSEVENYFMDIGKNKKNDHRTHIDKLKKKIMKKLKKEIPPLDEKQSDRSDEQPVDEMPDDVILGYIYWYRWLYFLCRGLGSTSFNNEHEEREKVQTDK